jgi:hypothetical protein
MRRLGSLDIDMKCRCLWVRSSYMTLAEGFCMLEETLTEGKRVAGAKMRRAIASYILRGFKAQGNLVED